MSVYKTSNSCLKCYAGIDSMVINYSMSNYKIPLCRSCQSWFKQKCTETTRETILLFLSLKKNGVPAELEKYDGHKTIDIAVTDAKVNIEVDGVHHNKDSKQALADLKRTFYAFKKGFLTLRIPNSLVKNELEETANYITDFLNVSKSQIGY